MFIFVVASSIETLFKSILVIFLSIFWFGWILRSASRAEFPISLSSHVGFTTRLCSHSSTHPSPEGFIHKHFCMNGYLQAYAFEKPSNIKYDKNSFV